LGQVLEQLGGRLSTARADPVAFELELVAEQGEVAEEGGLGGGVARVDLAEGVRDLLDALLVHGLFGEGGCPCFDSCRHMT
jgi:hypothetical protein